MPQLAAQSKEVTEDELRQLKYVKKLHKFLGKLRSVGCARDLAGNRDLFYDQYACMVLMSMFNPCLRSLRGISQASDLKKVQKMLGCKHMSIGSFSDASRVFDAEHLAQIVEELAQHAGQPNGHKQLEQINHTITLVDGTILKSLHKATTAMWTTRKGEDRHSWCMHTHYELLKNIPAQFKVTDGSGSGEKNERAVLGDSLQSDRCYVMDRGYFKHTLFNEIHKIKSSYVCRAADNASIKIVKDRALDEAAIEADIISDQIIEAGKGENAVDHPLRLVCVKIKPHVKRTGARGRSGSPSDGVLRIYTNLIDAPADVIAAIYESRYSIELFFRFFKQLMGCNHLLSEHPNGIAIQAYCAIIAYLLIVVHTGKKPTKRTLEMVNMWLMGWADDDEMMAHIEKLKNQG